MDEDKKRGDTEKAGSSLEAQDKKLGTLTASNSISSVDFLINQARKSVNFVKKVKPQPKPRKKRRARGRVQKRRREVRKIRRKPRPRNKEEKRRLNVSTHRKLKKIKCVSAKCQIGAPSSMFSKLFVSCSPMMPQNPGYANNYKEISPEMIFRALHDLAMWRHAITTEYIYKFINDRYPINPNTNEALLELLDKLRVAQISGIAWALPNECWRLTTALERIHRLDFTHVTLFWKTYWNTMKPLEKNRQNNVVQTDRKVTTEEDNVTDRYDII